MITRTAVFGVLLLIASHALAHTKLAGSTPAADATVAQSPESLVLEFAEPVRLTVVTLVNSAGVGHALSAVPAETAARFVLDVREPLARGAYVVTWRAVGADTHVVSGEIAFRVGAATP